MAYECIRYEKPNESVALITLNRPQRLNALSTQLVEEMLQALDEVEKDETVRALVITGAPRADGRPCFSAGADMREAAERGAGDPSARLVGLVRSMMDRGLEEGLPGMCSRVEMLDKPSIAAVDGVCTAGGMELALSCDIRVASETAQMSDMHIKNTGGIGGGGVTIRLARTVGPAWAKEIMFTGEPLNGHQAVAIGLANHVFPPDKLVEEALKLASKFASMRPSAIAMAKAAFLAATELNLERALRYSYLARSVLSSAEGYRAFAQGRPSPYTST